MLRSCMVDILEIVKNFDSINFRYNSKDLNTVTHLLAKFCFRSHMDVRYFNSFPACSCFVVLLIYVL